MSIENGGGVVVAEVGIGHYGVWVALRVALGELRQPGRLAHGLAAPLAL